MAQRRPGRGFTLIELVIVIAVIAILAALLVPVILNQVERARVASERRSISELAKAMQRFKNDTGSWPWEAGYWDATSDVNATPFNSSDVALFTWPTAAPPGMPGQLPQCSPVNVGVLCWGGPYLGQLTSGPTGSAPAALTDAWDNPRMFALIHPSDGGGGGTPSAPNGFVVVWSTGPDGLDSADCYNGGPPGCTRDLDRLAQGLPSQATLADGSPSDDIIQVAGTAQ